ncbi:MAG: hypothetical protein ABFD18_06115 [Syntrophomonas sp.]
MTREDLQEAIITTLDEIEQVKKLIEETTGMEQLRLLKRKKDLQTRQLWNIDQLEALRDK